MTDNANLQATQHWRIDVPFFGENRIRAIVALTPERFYLAQFVTAAGLDEADCHLDDGSDPAVTLGQKKVSRQFALSDVIAVEKTDFNQSVHIVHRKPSGALKRETIPTYTTPLYAEIFNALRDRLAPAAAPVEQVQASVGQVALKPTVFLTLAVLATAFFYWLALEAVGEAQWQRVGRRAGLKVMIYKLLRELGSVGVLLLGVAIVLAFAGWLMWRVLRRPVRSRFSVVGSG